MKLVICNSLPTSRIFGDKVDAWWYANHGVDVEFWDLAPIFIPADRLDQFYAGAANYRYVGPGHRVFTSAASLEDAIMANKASLFWHLSRFERMHNDDLIIDLFNRYHVRYIFQNFDPHDYIGSWEDYLKWPVRRSRARWYRRRCRPVAIVTSGALGRQQAQWCYPGADIISVPSVKVLWDREGSEAAVDYAVFVDESVVFDPDAQLHGHVLCSDVPGYYQRMRALFDRLEDALAIPVKIACSGKYIYPDAGARFGEREVNYGKTLPMLQGCVMALGHLSLALDQAIVSFKPVQLLDDMAFTPWRRRGFRDVKSRFRQQPLQNHEVGRLQLLSALERDLSFYTDVERKYFREPEVYGDARQICLDAFMEIADV